MAATIATNLNSPDLITLEEVEDNDAATNSTAVAADQTFNAEFTSQVSDHDPQVVRLRF